MSMAMLSLVADLEASLHDAGKVFTAPDYERHLDTAAADFHRARARLIRTSLTLVATVSEYDCPADLLCVWTAPWGQSGTQRLWDRGSASEQLPRVSVVGEGASRQLLFQPPPTAAQIADYGAIYSYFYRAAHAIDAVAADTTIRTEDRGLLLLRAQVEALRELAMRGVTKPVRLRDGLSQGPRNATPAALWESFMEEFERRVG